RHDVHALEVAERLGDRLLLLLGDHDQGLLLAPSLHDSRGLLRRGLVERVVGEDCEGSFVRVRRERGAESGLALLAVDLAAEVAADREGDAAAGPVWRPRRAGARTPGALLAPGLRASAGDEPAALDAVRGRPACVLLRAHGLVHKVRLDVGAENALVERQVLGLLAGA